ncbi:hypothetical protein [Streptomyces sp. NPDC050988]|uniref:hypothetical protein n=1 Tax=Streptomyces sp. NPDC050988 TaxID=3365637 RepID=UPI00379FCF85
MTEQDNEQAHAEWLAESLRTAQTGAMVWAQRADQEYEQAQHFEDRAQSWSDTAAYAETIAHEREQAQAHAARSTEARQLAEMWACVAAIVVPPPEPLELITAELGRTDG